MDIAVINSLFESGTLSQLYKGGFISDKIFTYREVYLSVSELTASGIKVSQAVSLVSTMYNKDKRTIWRMLRCFECADATMSLHE